jgi:PEP-CTERM motif
MKTFWLLSAGLVALSGSMFADSIWSGSAGSLNNIPTTATFVGTTPAYPDPSAGNTGTPYWNNASPDNINGSNHITNIGDVLSGYVTGTDLIGSNLVQSGGSALVAGTSGATNFNINGQYFAFTSTDATIPGGDPAMSDGSTKLTPSLEFSFLSNATSYAISMLYAAPSTQNSGVGNVGAPATTFGTYLLVGNVFTPTVIDSGIAANTSGTATSLATNDTLYGAGTVYGFYATVCYAWTGATCNESITYTTGAGNFSTGMTAGDPELGALGWNHFAVFELASGEEVLGFTDSPWPPGTTFGTQGLGDFSDAVIGLVGPGGSAPEPGTIAIMGLGLAGLGLIGRRRFVKK